MASVAPGPRPSRGRLLALGLVAVGVLVAVAVAVAWAWQRKLVYFPDASAVPPAAEVFETGEDLTLTTADGLDLDAWLVRPAAGRDRRAAVLYAPGNGGNREGRAGIARHLSERGFTVLLLDYRGYGGNPGSPSETGLALDADAALRALRERGFPRERTLYLGESLGTGVATGLATRHPPAGLVLRSPFTDLAAVGRHHYPWLPVGLLLRDRFPVAQPLRGSEVPVTVVYGDRDDVVPSALSAEVAQAARGLVDEVVISGAGHNDAVMFGPRVADAVADLADGVL